MHLVAPAQVSAADRWRIAFARVGTSSLAVAPAVILAQMLRLSMRAHSLAFDAANSYVPAARDLLDGRSPYHLQETSDAASRSHRRPWQASCSRRSLSCRRQSRHLAVDGPLPALLGALGALGVRD